MGPQDLIPPYEEIQDLVNRCRDPQQPESIQDSAEVVQAWLNGEPSDEEMEEGPDEPDDEDSEENDADEETETESEDA